MDDVEENTALKDYDESVRVELLGLLVILETKWLNH